MNPCPNCGEASDIHGDHTLSCRKNDFWKRHTDVCNLLCQCLSSAGIPHRREQSPLTSSSTNRPADILISSWKGGRPLALDVTIRHFSSSPQNFAAILKEVERVLEEKKKKYQAQCTSANWSFEPFLITSWGSLHGPALAIWKAITAACAAKVPAAFRPSVVSLLRNKLASTTARSVASQLQTLLLATAPRPYPELPLLPDRPASSFQPVLLGPDDLGNDEWDLVT